MKVLFVVNGDARSSRPWSGVPNHLLVEMVSRGIGVVNVDMSRVWHLRWPRILYNRIFRKVIRRWRNVPYEATRLCIEQTNKWLRKVAKHHADCDLALITSFCIDCTGVSLPCILVHDWTIGYARGILHGIRLSPFEEEAERNQLAALRTASKVVTFYPRVLDYLKSNNLTNVHFICNPIDTELGINALKRGHAASTSRHILVVGGNFYRENLEYVLEAADSLEDSGIVVDVVGQAKARYRPKYVKVNFFGYLDKTNPQQHKMYYDVLTNARCLVNVKKGWGGGSSIAEALCAGVPVICGDYADIVALYGEVARFGCYCEPGNIRMLADKLKVLLALEETAYVEMCFYAHCLVKDDTYHRFVDRWLVLDGAVR